MANILTHVSFSKRLLEHFEEDKDLSFLKTHKKAFFMGCVGPDFLYILRQFNIKGSKHLANYMHSFNIFETFENLQKYAFNSDNFNKKAYCLGLLCHYIVDYKLHPYVNYLIENKLAKNYSTYYQPVIHQIIEGHIDYYIIKDYEKSDEKHYKLFKDLSIPKKVKKDVYSVYKDVINDMFNCNLNFYKFNFSYFGIRTSLWSTYNKPTFIKKFMNYLEDKKSMKKLYTAFCMPTNDPSYLDIMNLHNNYYRKVRNLEDEININIYELLDECFEECVVRLKGFINNEKLLKEEFSINYDGIKIL